MLSPELLVQAEMLDAAVDRAALANAEYRAAVAYGGYMLKPEREALENVHMELGNLMEEARRMTAFVRRGR